MGTTSYSAVTVCPAPISPASFVSSLKSSVLSIRFSYPINRYLATRAGLNSTCSFTSLAIVTSVPDICRTKTRWASRSEST